MICDLAFWVCVKLKSFFFFWGGGGVGWGGFKDWRIFLESQDFGIFGGFCGFLNVNLESCSFSIGIWWCKIKFRVAVENK